jgi:hypothetical protein
MRKSNEIWYAIWFVVAVSLFISGCPFKSGVEEKEWFQYASKLDQERKKTLAHMAANKGEFIVDIAKIKKISQKLLRVRQPTETEIISALRSPNRRFQRVALVAMSIKPIETEKVMDILFVFFQDEDPEFRLHALLSLEQFSKIPESRKADFGKRLFEIIKTREDNELSPQELSSLAKVPSEEAAGFLTEQLMRDGEDIRLFRYCAFKALREMGDSYYNEAAEHVNKHGSPEIKKDLLAWEKPLLEKNNGQPKR